MVGHKFGEFAMTRKRAIHKKKVKKRNNMLKIAPAALRLYTNKQFDASWFGDRVYASLFHQTLQIKICNAHFESIGTGCSFS